MNLDDAVADAPRPHQALAALCEAEGEALSGFPVADVLALLTDARAPAGLAQVQKAAWAADLLAHWAGHVQQQLDEFPAADTDALRTIRDQLRRTLAALEALGHLLPEAVTAPSLAAPAAEAPVGPTLPWGPTPAAPMALPTGRPAR